MHYSGVGSSASHTSTLASMGTCRVRVAEGGGLELTKDFLGDLLVNTGLSMSMTSLSICTRSGTVSSSSALLSAAEMVLTYNIWSTFDACSYACASRQSANAATALWHQERYNEVNNICPSLDSRFLNLRRKSASSGEVIRIMLSLTTIMLANSRS